MAQRKPIVNNAGEWQVLQTGDDLNVPFSGVNEFSAVNDNASPIVIGAPVYVSAAGHVDKAKADAAGTSKTIGLVSATSIASAASGTIGVDGILTATTGQWDIITGGSGGLTPGAYYYLDAATAGKLTATAPSTSGQYVQRVGIALNATDFKIEIAPRLLL